MGEIADSRATRAYSLYMCRFPVMWVRVASNAPSVIDWFFVNESVNVSQRVSQMIGRLLGSRTKRVQRTGPLAAVPTPPNA
ncbi:hypothetical protein [Streptomyces mutabilis]|uniref:hypothetical protein n=1 Tax=Streptomyces mutabilis TaxID=67332 RepID=UPI0005B853EB|nr:hypothetical protein [Streptomyces mutabilis]